MAWQLGAVRRLRGFQSLDLLMRVLLLHVARGYSLRETVVRARLANWTDISDVALLKRLRHSEEWLRFLCVELFRENIAYRFDAGINSTVRIVDGTIVREPGKTGYFDSISRPLLRTHIVQYPDAAGDFRDGQR